VRVRESGGRGRGEGDGGGVRLVGRMLRPRDLATRYWEGEASGAAILTTSYGSPDREALLPQLTDWAKRVYAGNGVVFAAILMRLLIFSEVTFKFQSADDKHLFGNPTLSVLEHPFGPDSHTGELLGRRGRAVSLAANSYTGQPRGEDRLVRLRPDWTTIVSELVDVPGGGQYRRKVGFMFGDPAKLANNPDLAQFYDTDEV